MRSTASAADRALVEQGDELGVEVAEHRAGPRLGGLGVGVLEDLDRLNTRSDSGGTGRRPIRLYDPPPMRRLVLGLVVAASLAGRCSWRRGRWRRRPGGIDLDAGAHHDSRAITSPRGPVRTRCRRARVLGALLAAWRNGDRQRPWP